MENVSNIVHQNVAIAWETQQIAFGVQTHIIPSSIFIRFSNQSIPITSLTMIIQAKLVLQTAVYTTL